MWSSSRENIPSDPVADGRRSGIVHTENTVRHTKYGRIRGMAVGEGGRSTGVLLYMYFTHTRIIQYTPQRTLYE